MMKFAGSEIPSNVGRTDFCAKKYIKVGEVTIKIFIPPTTADRNEILSDPFES